LSVLGFFLEKPLDGESKSPDMGKKMGGWAGITNDCLSK